MGLITNLRTIKRSANGDMDRDVDTMVGPARIVLESEFGSSARLRAAVADRHRLEDGLDGAYLRGLQAQLRKDEIGRNFLRVSDMAGLAVVTDDWSELVGLAAAIDPNHWLVRGSAPTAEEVSQGQSGALCSDHRTVGTRVPGVAPS